MTTWREVVREATAQLGSAEDARRIAERASGNEGAAWILGLDEPVTTRALAHFDAMVQRRLGGEPLQYTLGSWGFRGLDLLVDKRVLIPRPETESVVEVALEHLRERSGRRRVFDLGTGSGAIALSIVSELPLGSVDVWASDVSSDAVAVARANLAGIGRRGTHVRLLEGSWFEPFAALEAELAGRIDVIVANPPYVALDEHLPAEVAEWEPRTALYAGPSGLECIETIAREAVLWLAPHGVVVLEIGATQGATAAELLRDRGYREVKVRSDLAGRDRILVGRRPATDADR